MRFIIEWDGVIANVMPGYFLAHRAAAQTVGWSRLDEATFRRLTRTRGSEADILPGAKATKLEAYDAEFDRLVETSNAVAQCEPHPALSDMVRQLQRFGLVFLVTARPNIDERRQWLTRREWSGGVECFERLSDDPRRRPVELKALAANDDRAMVVASSDIVVRSADAADLFVVGVSSGTCSVKRLQQAGARIVYKTLDQLTASLRAGAADLVRAGMLPLTVG